MLSLQTFAFSDKGPRSSNQDSFCLEFGEESLLIAVADGVGGNTGGDIASRTAIDVVRDGFFRHLSLEESAKAAHETLLQKGAEDPQIAGMATTLTSATVENGKLVGLHCGDSRAYVLRGNGIRQLTKDHTEVAKLLEEGLLTKETARDYPRRNVLTSAIGSHKNPVFQSFAFELELGDRLLLLTDGIYASISKWEICSLSAAYSNFESFCLQIVDSVELASPKDNFTLVGVQF